MLKQFFVNYYHRTINYSVVRILVEFTLISRILGIILPLMVSLLILLPLGLITHQGDSLVNNFIQEQEFTNSMSIGELSMLSVFFTPIIETFLFQVIIIAIISLFTSKPFSKIIISGLIFALIHLEPMAIISIIPSGILYSWAYVIYQSKSTWKAYWLVVVLHSFGNLLSIINRVIIP